MTAAADASDVERVALFLAILAVVAELAVLLAVIASVGSLLHPGVRRWWGLLRRDVAGLGTWLALAVAVVATSGSLYFSEVAGFPPCRLCWYQRYCMYPLVPILAVALLRPSWRLWRLALPLAVVGAGIATYHSAIERWPTLEVTSCDRTNPCTLRWVEELGYLTIPLMSLSAFLLIITSLVLDVRRPKERS